MTTVSDHIMSETINYESWHNMTILIQCTSDFKRDYTRFSHRQTRRTWCRFIARSDTKKCPIFWHSLFKGGSRGMTPPPPFFSIGHPLSPRLYKNSPNIFSITKVSCRRAVKNITKIWRNCSFLGLVNGLN